MIEGNFPYLAEDPLVAVLYAFNYLIVGGQHFWLLYSCIIGRFVLLALLWLSLFLVAKRIRLAHPLTALFLALIFSPIFTNLLTNPCHALFVSLSGLTLWQVLAFYTDKKIKHVWLASLLLGLAALVRQDGLLLLPGLVIISCVLTKTIRRAGAVLIASVVPFALILGSYLLLYRAATGTFHLGSAHRAYYAFEQAEGAVFSDLYGKNNRLAHTEGQIQARILYGTEKENKGNILSAISRNPAAFFKRVKQNLLIFPKKILSDYSIPYGYKGINGYGRGVGIFFFLLVIRGIIEIARKKLYILGSILFLWTAYVGIYLFVNFTGYLLLPCIVLLIFASVGVTAAVSNIHNKVEYINWCVLAVILIIIAGFLNSSGLFWGHWFFFWGYYALCA